MPVEFATLHSILQYELNSAERHRRYVSLMMVHSPIDQEGLEQTLDVHVRNSDVLAQVDDSVTVLLMSETDKGDALQAIDRYSPFVKERYNPLYSVATYPADEHQPEALFQLAKKRLHLAKSRANGIRVVSED